MSTGLQFDITSNEARGGKGVKYSEGSEGTPRALYSFVGFLVGAIGGLIKQLAFREPVAEDSGTANAEADVDENSFHVVGSGTAPPGSSGLFHAEATDTKQSSEPPIKAMKTSGDGHGVYSAQPISLSDAKNFDLAHLHTSANDNSAMHMPLQASLKMFPPLIPASSENTEGHGTAGVTASDEKKIDQTKTEEDSPEETRNRAPVVQAPVNLGQLYVNTAVVIALSDFLANAYDPDADVLSVDKISVSSGALKYDGDQAWYYTPTPDNDGNVTFTYLVSDGVIGIEQTAFLEFIHQPVAWSFGSESDDVLIGTNRDDMIAALGGADVVLGDAGNDEIDGGDGDDIIFGGAGDDFIIAGSGNDVVDSGSGNDIVFAGSGNDTIFAGDGNDIIYGESGDDTIISGFGDDVVDAGIGNDFIIALASIGTARSDTDLFSGSASIDLQVVEGSLAQQDGSSVPPDFMQPPDVGLTNKAPTSPVAEGSATVEAELVDVIFANDGNDFYNGGDGIDTYDLSATQADAVINLSTGRAWSSEIGRDVIINIENIMAGSGDDVLVASAAQNRLSGGEGDDTFVFTEAAMTGPSPEAMDCIVDFQIGDKIDVSRIDADENEDGKQLFEFKGNAEKFEKSGELRYKYEDREDGKHTIVLGNTDDDDDEEFSIDVVGYQEFHADDFYGVL